MLKVTTISTTLLLFCLMLVATAVQADPMTEAYLQQATSGNGSPQITPNPINLPSIDSGRYVDGKVVPTERMVRILDLWGKLMTLEIDRVGSDGQIDVINALFAVQMQMLRNQEVQANENSRLEIAMLENRLVDSPNRAMKAEHSPDSLDITINNTLNGR